MSRSGILIIGEVSRPASPSQKSDRVRRSAIECRAKKSASMRALIASPATALAPLSQNSMRCRCPGGGSGQAQPGQSNPLGWLMTDNVFSVRRTPILVMVRFAVFAIAGTPVDHRSGGWTVASVDSRSDVIGKVVIAERTEIGPPLPRLAAPPKTTDQGGSHSPRRSDDCSMKCHCCSRLSVVPERQQPWRPMPR